MLELLFGGRHLTFESPLRIEEATLRLRQDVATPEWRMFENRPQAFFGTITGDRFHLERLIKGRNANAFRPVISGRLSPGVNGSRVDVRLKLSAVGVFAWALYLLINLPVFWFALPAGVAIVTRDPTFVPSPITWIALVFLCVAPLMPVSAALVTMMEARRATRLLARVFSSSPSQRMA